MSQDDLRERDPSESAEGEESPQYLATPPEGPKAVESYGTTIREQQQGEPLRLRLGQELPDDHARREQVGRLVDPESEDQLDETPQLVALESEQDPSDLAAEEAAVHLEEEPPSET